MAISPLDFHARREGEKEQDHVPKEQSIHPVGLEPLLIKTASADAPNADHQDRSEDHQGTESALTHGISFANTF
jgi:hypothetical protein